MYKSLFIFLFISNFTLGQNITESLLVFTEGYSSGNLLVNYYRSYEVGSTDTTFNVLFKLTNKESQVDGFSLGSAFFGSRSAFGFNMNVRTSVSSDEVILNAKQFDQFMECLGKVFIFLLDKQRFSKDGLNTVASCAVDGLAIGGELLPSKANNKEIVFYLKLGDKNYYKATLEEYRSTIQKFSKIQTDLKNRDLK